MAACSGAVTSRRLEAMAMSSARLSSWVARPGANPSEKMIALGRMRATIIRPVSRS